MEIEEGIMGVMGFFPQVGGCFVWTSHKSS